MSKLQEENLGILRSRILFTTPLTCWLSFTCTLCSGGIHPTTVSSIVDHHRPSSSSSPSLSSSSSSVSPKRCWSWSILFENQAIPRVVEIEKTASNSLSGRFDWHFEAELTTAGCPAFDAVIIFWNVFLHFCCSIFALFSSPPHLVARTPQAIWGTWLHGEANGAG